jgi:hypothetical protein
VDEHEHKIDEPTLWSYAGKGILIAMLVFAVLGFVVLSISAPDLDLVPKLGASAFIGFWGGPVFGMAGAVGVHDLIVARRANRAAH